LNACHHDRAELLPLRPAARLRALARFAHALLSHKLLRPDSTKLLITGKVEAGPVRYAHGFEDARDAGRNGWVGKGGVAPGMNGDLKIYPRSGYVVAVLANIDPPAAQRISDYLDARLPGAARPGRHPAQLRRKP
jgi:hypothetical protein